MIIRHPIRAQGKVAAQYLALIILSVARLAAECLSGFSGEDLKAGGILMRQGKYAEAEAK